MLPRSCKGGDELAAFPMALDATNEPHGVSSSLVVLFPTGSLCPASRQHGKATFNGRVVGLLPAWTPVVVHFFSVLFDGALIF
jgi:hypothetical protein